jgi:2-polyprenyl-6-methoxyphenol hydroxylase-like FAD-dependent oxidoreductase
MDLKVLIVGGGVAGPALAHWLSRAGARQASRSTSARRASI